MKPLDENLLHIATQRLVEEFRPEEIWLFGSHAWGTATPDSDVDLMVIVRESSEPAVRRTRRALRCLRDLRVPKDVLVPTRAEVDRYKHLRASLFHQVLTRGRKLYG
jgi:predicted nucleotidyltransferase